MATGGLYGSTSTGTVAPQSGSESVGLYGNNTVFGGTYFEWFIFQEAATQPATPTGGTWNFTTNVGTPPAGWTGSPPVAPTNKVWVCIGVVNSRSTAAIVWSTPGLFALPSGTVTNVSALTLGTAGFDVSSTVANPTTTPVITLNLPTASASNRGLLSSADWTAFNAKQPSGTYVNSVSGTIGRITSTGGVTPIIDLASGIATAGTTGSASLIPVVTIDTYGRVTGITTAANPQGTVTSVAATVPSFLSISGSPITSSGTLAIGYSGTALPVLNGGTGATTAGGALTNLGAIGNIASADGSVSIAQTGTSVDLSVVTAGSTNTVLVQVRNTTGATLTKGTVVYMSGATGQIPTVSKALATSDATSAQTLGMMSADLANNSNGYVTVIGLLSNMDTSAFTDGAQLYLSGTTAGTYTSTKTYAPIHLVYIGFVEYAHPTQGKIFVKVQNGYELDEIHNVSARTPTTGQTIVWNGATNLWEQNTVSLTAGVNGTLAIGNGGTGQTTAAAAITALSGTQTSGYYLRSNGTNTLLAAIVAADVPTLNQNTTGTAANITATSNSTLTTLSALSLPGSQVSGNISGNAANVTGTVAVVNGGTGLTSFTTGQIHYGSFSTSANLFYDSTNTRLGVGTNTPAVTASLVGTDAILLPKGTTAQQPTGVAGYLRFNTTTSQFEGYNGSAWSSVGGAAISNDTTTATNVYPLFANATSGTALTVYTGNAKLLYKPSTGELQASEVVASNGLFVNATSITASYTIGTGYNAQSVGPVTIASGQSVTVSSGQRWLVL